MAKPHHVNNAKAVVGLLVLAIAFVIFYKFVTNQGNLFEDPEALRNYVLFAIVGGGFLIGLLYLTSQTTHKEPSKGSKPSKSKKKKK
jgi:multisubunit Na+/H+ antiporter MnhB subunit